MMQQTVILPAAGQGKAARTADIAKSARAEAAQLARIELQRFIDLTEKLTPTDWERPTACTLWTVKDIVAHQAAHVIAGTRFTEFLSQFNARNFRDYTARGMNSLDAANQRQVDLRAGRTPAELIAEIKTNSERSLQGRQRFPWLLRFMPIPVPGHDGRLNLGELIDIIFTRDMWMHRLDICRATGHSMTLTADHDGRITALSMRELGMTLQGKLKDAAVIYRLTGPAGGEWVLGGGQAPTAIISMDTLDFNWLASRHVDAQQALAQGWIGIEGDQALAETVLKFTAVLY